MSEVKQKDAHNRNRFQYRLSVLHNASFKKFFGVIDRLSELSGKNKLWLIYDVLRSMKKFDSGYYDYLNFQWYNLKDWQRDTYLTRFRSKKLIMMVNDQSKSHIFDDKIEFNKVFKEYLGREFIDVNGASDQEIIEYFERKDKIFCKMLDLSCGIGAELIETKDFKDGKTFCEYVRSKGFGTLEDVVENHPKLAEIYPFAVNCMRMITLIDDFGDVHLVYCAQKFGNEGRVVDNLGLYGPLNLKTGEFLCDAHHGEPSFDIHFAEHPYSGKKLQGFKTPFFKEAKEMVFKAAYVVPEIRYVGWDVAITPSGPVIIEGNDYCAHDFWQLPGQTPGGIGIMPVFERLLPEFRLRKMAGKQEQLLKDLAFPGYNSDKLKVK